MTFVSGEYPQCGAKEQLVAFVRAYLSNPHVLILDEATSSIDSARVSSGFNGRPKPLQRVGHRCSPHID